MQKWNNQKLEYEPYEIPKEWYCPIFARLYEYINCASCGKKLMVAECYTSKKIHNEVGLGYCVCGECYKKEWR